VPHTECVILQFICRVCHTLLEAYSQTHSPALHDTKIVTHPDGNEATLVWV